MMFNKCSNAHNYYVKRQLKLKMKTNEIKEIFNNLSKLTRTSKLSEKLKTLTTQQKQIFFPSERLTEIFVDQK